MSVRSLSRIEAEERAALLAVERYDIAIDLTDLPTGPEVRCVSTVTFASRRPGASTFVDCAAEVVSATLNDVPLPPAADGRIALADLAATNVLRVESVQANTAHGEGAHKATDPADGEVYLWMSFEPDEARYVWACFDQPDLKAAHAFTVTAPAAWTVLSNSGDPRVEDVDGARCWTFPDTPPLSTYNTVVNAGPLYEIRREAGDHDLGILARRSLAAVLDRDADEIFRVTAQGLAFFANKFGKTFPQRKYDQVFMPEFGGAMENYGCVTWADTSLRRTPPTPVERERFAQILLHEMAHMWFGNMVTMRWWDDLWLNEAFAEFACLWAAERSTEYTGSWAGFLAGEKRDAYLADQGPTTHPIRQPVADVAEAASIFDDITYPKGASVLHQLMTYVGEDRFTAGLKEYFARHAWGNTTLQDLMEALGAAAGRDLTAWTEGWLDTAGTDRLTLEPDGAGFVLVDQGPGGRARPQVLGVGAYRRNGGALERTALVDVEVQGPRTPVGLPPGADLYLINDDDLTFATTRPAPGTEAALLAAAAQLPTPISRAVAVASVWDMLANGQAAPADVVGCLLGVLGVETADSVIEPYLTLACDVAELWAGDVDRPALLARVAVACREFAADPARRQVALRAFARTAPALDDIAWLQAEAGDDTDIGWRALIRKSELGGDTAAEVERLRERDPDPDVRFREVAVLAARPDADAKREAWRAMVVDKTVPFASVFPVANAFWRPGQDEALTGYAERYLELLPTFDGGGMIPAMVYTGRLFPVFTVDEAYIARAREAAGTAAPVVRKRLLERSDLILRMLRTRA